MKKLCRFSVLDRFTVMATPSAEEILPRLLTHKNAKGEIYKRLSIVELGIAHWETVDANLIAAAAGSVNHRSNNFIKLEVLFSLLRSAGKDQRHSDFYTLFPAFIARVRTLIRQRSRLYGGNLDELLEVTCSALALKLAEDAANPFEDEIDYFEVRFASGLHYFVQDRIEETNRWYGRHLSVDDDLGPDEFIVGALPEHSDLSGPEKAAFAAEINEKLHLLSDEEHRIIDLHFLQGIKINSKDEDEPTIVKMLKLSERTVHYRIESAGKKLSKFKERK